MVYRGFIEALDTWKVLKVDLSALYILSSVIYYFICYTHMLPITYSKPLFWSKVEIVIDTQQLTFPLEQLDEVISVVYKEAIQLQSIFNFFDPKSELSLLNQNREGYLSPQLLSLIITSLEWAYITHGAYDITLGKQILQRKQHLPITPIDGLYKYVAVEKNHVTLLHEDIMIDLGSIAKGYIGDKIAESLMKKWCMAGLVDARWDIVVFGSYEEHLWIQDPRIPTDEVGQFMLKNAAVATSGDYNQFDTAYTLSHILHQREFSSLTVVAPTLTQADLFATVLFVCDHDMRKNILVHHPELKVLGVDQSNNVQSYNDSESFYILPQQHTLHA